MFGSMVDIQSPTTEIIGEEKRRRKKDAQLQNTMACALLWTVIKKEPKTI